MRHLYLGIPNKPNNFNYAVAGIAATDVGGSINKIVWKKITRVNLQLNAIGEIALGLAVIKHRSDKIRNFSSSSKIY